MGKGTRLREARATRKRTREEHNRRPDEGFMPATSEKIGIFIGVPSRGLVRGEWAVALKSLVEPVNMSWGVRLIAGERLEVARNSIVADARDSGGGAKYVFFLDDDILVPQQALRTLAYLLEQHDEWDLITAVCPTKTTPASPTIFQDRTSGPYWDWRFGDVFPIHSCGLAATLVRVSAFDKVGEPWFREVETSNVECDLDFCNRLRKAGGTLMAHGGMLAGHMDREGKLYALPADSKPLRELTESDIGDHIVHATEG